MPYMTEDEAGKRWCPNARAAFTPWETTISSNRVDSGRPDPECLCVASRCMAWRWRQPTRDGEQATRGDVIREVAGAAMPEHVEGHAWRFDRAGGKWGLFAKAGFCGAFGVPTP